jgi:hypothetical protein
MTHRLIPRRRFLAGAGAVAISGSPNRHAANAQATSLRLPASPFHPPASFILNNGKVVTLDRTSTIAQALAVAGNRIVAVGPNDTMAQAPNNPVYIRSIWGFWRGSFPLVSCANTEALRRAGITRDTVSPVQTLTVVKDANGEPTGVFIEREFQPIAELFWFRDAIKPRHWTRPFTPHFRPSDRGNFLVETVIFAW